MDDFEAIKQLMARYCRGADTKDMALLRSTLSDDFFVDTGATGRGATRGADPFIERVLGNPDLTDHRPILPEIELTSPSTATAIWSVQLVSRAADGRATSGFGYYHVNYAKVDDAWRMRSLQLDWRHHESQGPEVGAANQSGEAPDL